MFRRILSFLLILSIFGYGMALAADLHGGSLEKPGSALHQPDDQGKHQQGADDGDHCSHGVFHLLGIRSVMEVALMPARELPASRYLEQATNFAPPLLLRPPITA